MPCGNVLGKAVQCAVGPASGSRASSQCGMPADRLEYSRRHSMLESAQAFPYDFGVFLDMFF